MRDLVARFRKIVRWSNYSRPFRESSVRSEVERPAERKIGGISATVVVLGALVTLATSLYFFREQTIRPPCCDATQYLQLAERVDAQGGQGLADELRTFMFPWILSILKRLSAFVNLPFNFLLLSLQVGFYLVAAVIISGVIGGGSRLLASLVYLLLCCNLFVAPYLSIPLTDGLYTSISLIVFAIIARNQLYLENGRAIKLSTLVVMCSLATSAVVIRPAAIWLFGLVLLCCAQLVIRRRVALSDALLAISIAFIPLIIQISINTQAFGKLSFFPVYDLGSRQLKWGIENLKYATWMDGGPSQYFYKSGYLVEEEIATTPILWYARNFTAGIKLLALKLIAAFDFDSLVPYVYGWPSRPWIASCFSFSFLYGGFAGACLHLFGGSLKVLGSRWTPLLLIVAWASVSLSSATELRFTLPLISYFMVVSVVLAHHLVVSRRLLLSGVVVMIGLLLVPLVISMAAHVRAQGQQISKDSVGRPS